MTSTGPCTDDESREEEVHGGVGKCLQKARSRDKQAGQQAQCEERVIQRPDQGRSCLLATLSVPGLIFLPSSSGQC